jgi:intein/homing endonuclease
LCGLVNIKDIQKGDFVLTHKGYEKVLKRFYNGYKQVNNYLLQFDTFSVTIECTPDHKIKTTQGWKQISKLQSGMEIYHDSYLGEKSTTYTQTKNIFPKEEEGCIPMYGNSLTGKFRKVLTSITKMVTRGITELKIWNLKRKIFTGLNTQNYDSKTILFSPKNSKVKEFNWLKFGINPPMELNGIKGTELSLMQYENLLNISVNNAGKFIIRDIQGLQNSVIQTAKLKHLEVGEEKKKRVYDLSVNKTHEYFANGILVHNCRYAINSFHPLEDQGEDMDIPDDTKRVAML